MAVIVVLAIIALIATPIVLNTIKKSQKSAAERSAERYIGAVETWVATERLEGRVVEDGLYLIDEISVEASGTLPSEGWVEIEIGIVVDYSLKREDYVINYDTTKKIPVAVKDGKIIYKPIPELASGMLPVKYDGDNWKVVDTSSKYYNYNNQEWANAVILKSGVTKNTGDIVDVANDVQAMFVYIPRYEYKIEGSYGKGGTSTNPTILPDVQSLTNQKVSAQFTTAQIFNNYISGAEAHMMKNSEWGAATDQDYAGFSSKPDSKYYDDYTTNNTTTACNGGICYGHAINETSSWYKDRTLFVSVNNPWFLRGGYYLDGNFAGVFYRNYYRGQAHNNISFRVVCS